MHFNVFDGLKICLNFTKFIVFFQRAFLKSFKIFGINFYEFSKLLSN